jgi:hypothetical protein
LPVQLTGDNVASLSSSYTVASIKAPVTVADGSVVSLSSSYTVAAIKASLPAGNNNIGNVDIVSGTITEVTDITNPISLSSSYTVLIKSGTVTAVTDITNPISLSSSYTVLIKSGTVTAVTDITNPISLSSSYTVLIKSGTVTAVTDITNPISLSSSYTVAAIKASLPAGDNNIGNVDIVTVPDVSLTGSVCVYVSTIGAVSLTGSAKTLLSDIDDKLAGTLTVGSHAVTNAGTFAVQASLTGSGCVAVQGTVAHGAAASGASPILAGWEARTSMPTAVDNGDLVRPMADDNGRMITVANSPRDLVGQTVLSLTVSTTTTLLAAGGAGVLRDITSLVLTNPSSVSKADVTIYSSVTTGTVIFRAILPESGGLVHNPATPIPAQTANVAWGVKCNVVGLIATIQYVDNN